MHKGENLLENVGVVLKMEMNIDVVFSFAFVAAFIQTDKHLTYIDGDLSGVPLEVSLTDCDSVNSCFDPHTHAFTHQGSENSAVINNTCIHTVLHHHVCDSH